MPGILRRDVISRRNIGREFLSYWLSAVTWSFSVDKTGVEPSVGALSGQKLNRTVASCSCSQSQKSEKTENLRGKRENQRRETSWNNSGKATFEEGKNRTNGDRLRLNQRELTSTLQVLQGHAPASMQQCTRDVQSRAKSVEPPCVGMCIILCSEPQ